jgi:hypothetical protein
LAGDAVTILNYTSSIAALPTSRNVQDFTATAAQTTFTVTAGYIVGLIDVFVNGSKLTSSEFTATNGTTFVLTVASTVGDQVQSINYTASVNGISGAGTANYVPKFTASGTIGNSLIFDNGTNVGIGNIVPANALSIDEGIATASYLQFTAGTTTGILATDGFKVGIDASANAIINQQENLPLIMYTNGAERLRILAGGNVGIGITTAASPLTIQATSGGAGIRMVGRSPGNQDNEIAFIANDNSTIQGYLTASNAGMDLLTIVNQPMRFHTNSVERMRIGSGGGLVVATNNSGTVRSSIGEGTLELVRASSNTVQAGSYLQFTDPSNARYWVLQQDASYNWATWHYNGGWAKVGYQSPAGTWTNSDIRRKKDFENVEYGLAEILELNPQKFRFIKQTKDEQKSLGFIAQEVLSIIPEAVQSDMDGDEQYYAMNYSNLVPVLVKAIQEQQSQIEELKTLLKAK